MLPCHIVKDLLPSYLDHLTGPETAADICEHLKACPDCRAVRDAMAADLEAEKAPPPKLNFLKRFRWQQRLGAILSVAMTLLCLVGLYRSEYRYDLTNTAEIETLITGNLTRSRLTDALQSSYFPWLEIDVLEMTSVKDRVFVLYKAEQRGSFKYQGYAEFQKGIFGGCRFRSWNSTDWPIADTSALKLGKQNYMIVYSTNWPEEAANFAVFPGYHPPSYAGEADVLPDLSTLTPAYEGMAARSILQVIPVTEEQVKAGLYGSSSVVYYDAEGNRLDNGELAEPYQNETDGFGGSGGTAAEPGAIYVWCGIVILLGGVITRYFLCPEPKKKRKSFQ